MTDMLLNDKITKEAYGKNRKIYSRNHELPQEDFFRFSIDSAVGEAFILTLKQ